MPKLSPCNYRPIEAAGALQIGLVHEVWPDHVFEAGLMKFCRHLARQNPEQMGAAKIAIELCQEVGRDSARHIERLANSALSLNPDYAADRAEYVKGIGSRKWQRDSHCREPFQGEKIRAGMIRIRLRNF